MNKIPYIFGVIVILLFFTACEQPQIESPDAEDGTAEDGSSSDGDSSGGDGGGGSVPAPTLLLFASDRDGGDLDIFSLNLDTDTLTQLTANDSIEDKHPALSADGTKIVFVSNRSGSHAIHTMNADGTGVSSALYTLSGASDGHPSWSPDGTKIAFDDGADILIMNADGSGQVNMSSTVFDNERDPEFSPNGDTLVYASDVDTDYEIFTRSSDDYDWSETPLQITSNSAVDQEPSWSPDGTKIAYSTNLSGNYDIYAVGSDGSSPGSVMSSGDDEALPSWSDDGIAYVKNGEVHTFQPGNAGSDENVTNNAVVDQDPSW